jgi:hypothetical protein
MDNSKTLKTFGKQDTGRGHKKKQKTKNKKRKRKTTKLGAEKRSNTKTTKNREWNRVLVKGTSPCYSYGQDVLDTSCLRPLAFFIQGRSNYLACQSFCHLAYVIKFIPETHREY